MKNQKSISLLPFILVAALLAGCGTTVLVDDTVLPSGPSVSYEQATALARAVGRNDPFNAVVANYRAANPKPQLPEEARKFKVQAEFAVQQKQFDTAADLYGKALEIAPWWPEGHFNRALILGELKQYQRAIREMKLYVRLAPDAPDARAAQDKIYQWEGMALSEISEIVEFRDCPDCPVMVSLGKGYAIGKYEVTQKEWQAVMGNNPSDFQSANRPVEKVSWGDTQDYIKKLNQKTGKRYRLPTEAEWEYACYGGSKTEYCGGNDVDSVAWVKGNSGGQTHPVGQKQANGYGLYDMSGNVWEWISDCSEGNCVQYEIRGGSWLENPLYMHATDSLGLDARGKGTDIGFRLVRTLP